MEIVKRSRSGSSNDLDLAKKGRGAESSALVVHDNSLSTELVDSLVGRTSLEAPNLLLTGHSSTVTSLAFNTAGDFLASASRDKTILLWSVGSSGCENTALIRGHKNAVLDICWSSDGTQLYSVSADKNGGIWDVASGQRVRTLQGHSKIVNAVSGNRRLSPLVATASDDGFCKLWDTRSRRPFFSLRESDEEYPLLAVCLSDDSSSVFIAGVSGDITHWDLRSSKPLNTISGHQDIITHLSLSPDGSTLLSHSMDNTVRTWDVRPYCPKDARALNVYRGASNNFEQNLLKTAFSHCGQYVMAGSADRNVRIYTISSCSPSSFPFLFFFVSLSLFFLGAPA